MNKVDLLKELRNHIVDKIYKERWEEVWFFPEYAEVPSVKGYLGTDSVVFISLNPSSGSYPTKNDIFYYENLKQYGFANAHLTDIFKIKATGKSTINLFKDSGYISEAKEILKKEFSIINPKLIVFVGDKANNFFHKNFEDLLKHVEFEQIPHYSPQHLTKEAKEQFVINFAAALERIKIKYVKILQSKTDKKSLRS